MDFIISPRSLAMYGPTNANKLRLVGHEIFTSTVAEYEGTVVKLLSHTGLASFIDPGEAIKSAIRMGTILDRRNGEVPEDQKVGYIISVNQGDGIIENEDAYGPVIDRLTRMTHMTGRKNDICISEGIHGTVSVLDGTERRQVGTITDGPSRKCDVYQVTWSGAVDLKAQERTLIGQFQHRYTLVEGVHEPCFYCGSRKHLLSHCPSKHIPEVTRVFDKLRYLSVRQINALFSESIGIGLDKVRHTWENTDDVPDAYFHAYHAFYEIKRVYQLRFFRVIMGYRGNDWQKATRISPEASDGGPLMVALDHIRTGNLNQADTILQKLLSESPDQFNVHMLMGYLNVEKGYYKFALSSFESAYKNGTTNPDKILALLLMSRINSLYFNDIRAAEERLGLIRRLEHDCPEATYQSIILRMRYEKDSPALQQLVHLVNGHRDYYLISLIDPELVGCQAKVNKELQLLFIHAEGNAASAIDGAEIRVKRLESWLGEDDENARNLRETCSATRALLASDSYTGYLDVVYKAPSITAGCDRLQRKSREKIKGLSTDIYHQILDLSDYCARNRKTELVDILDDLEREVAAFAKDLDSSVPYKDATITLQTFSDRIRVIREAVDKHREAKAIVSFFLGLLMKTLIYFVVTASTGLLILFVIDLGGAFSGAATPSVMDGDKRTVFIFATIISVVSAIIIEYKRLLKTQKRTA